MRALAFVLLSAFTAVGLGQGKPADPVSQFHHKLIVEAAIAHAVAVSPDLADCREANWPDTGHCNSVAREMMKLIEQKVHEAGQTLYLPAPKNPTPEAH